ncbi:MAG: hypothetical protein WB709_03850, partial [Solirubrobacteraceae bacterium]
VKAGDHTALNLTLHDGSRYPLKTLAPTAAFAGLLAMCAMRLFRNEPESRVRVEVGSSPHGQRVPAG